MPFTATTPYTWPRTPDDAPRTGKEPCDGAVFPLGYGLDADGALPAAGRLPLTGTPGYRPSVTEARRSSAHRRTGRTARR